MKYSLLIPILFLFACNSQKRIQTSQARVDSVAANVVKELQQKHSLDSASWANEKKQLTETGIVFENDPCPNVDSIKAAWDNNILHPTKESADRLAKEIDKLLYEKNRIEFNADGSIKSAEGRIKSLSLKVDSWQKEAYTWKSKYDSLAEKSDSSGVTKNVAIDTNKVDKKTKSNIWWLWLSIGAVIGWFLPGLWRGLKKKVGIVALLLICGNCFSQKGYFVVSDTMNDKGIICQLTERTCPPGYTYLFGLQSSSLVIRNDCYPDSIAKRLQKEFAKNICGETGLYMSNGDVVYSRDNTWSDSLGCISKQVWKKRVGDKWIEITHEEYTKLCKCEYVFENGKMVPAWKE